ncbi:MAG: hypothetical protein M3Y55_12425 [Pseudomonadota bacterium]|nr:hypothetical protein [Pseudomonadota bacterium]
MMSIRTVAIGLAVAATSLLASGSALAQQKRAAPAAAVPVAAEPAAKQDQADLDRSQIIGNRELPKVLYIVPWKKPGPGDLSGRPLVSVLDEALAPVDRDVFRRQVRYDAQTVARSQESTPAAVPAPSK